jgi:phage host-nuclease inhibitor protein Gam
LRLHQYLDISLQYLAQEVEVLKAEYKETITNLKEERENAAKMALEQTETLHKGELQREVLKATNEANTMIAALKDRNEQLANTIDSLNCKIAELQNEAPTKSAR